MSNQSSNTFSSSSSFSYSSSSSEINGHASGQAFTRSSHTNPSGTTVQTASQNLGEPVIRETRNYDSQGQELLGNGSNGTVGRIEDVSDEEQAQRDREYEERIEDEYAKREGGA